MHYGNERALPRLGAIGISLAFASALAASCSGVWGQFDNPADPESDLYQGFATVADPNDVGTVSASPDTAASRLTLLCDAVVGAVSYQFQVDDDEGFAAPLFQTTTTGANTCVATGLLTGTRYWWRVKASTASATGDWSPPTATFIPLPAPTLSSPANLSAFNGGTTIPFAWQAVTRAAKYNLYVASTSEALATAAPTTVSTSTSASSYLSEGTWYWRVCAVDAFDGVGAPSETRSITVRPYYDFSSYSWPSGFTSSGDDDWDIESGTATSGDIDNNETSTLTFTYRVPAGKRLTNITFRYRVSSEHNYDYLIFSVGLFEKQRWSGSIDWSSYSYSMDYAQNTTVVFKWKYDKDSSSSSGSDCAWIDDISLTLE